MSLINDALKDLANSNQTRSKNNHHTVKSLAYSPYDERKPIVLISLVSILSIIILAIIGFIYFKGEQFKFQATKKAADKTYMAVTKSSSVVSSDESQRDISNTIDVKQNKQQAANPLLDSHSAQSIKQLSISLKDQADTLYQSALAQVKLGNLTEAITNLNKVIDIDARNNKARQVLIVLLLQNKDKAQAKTVLNQGLVISPDYLPFVKLKAHFYIDDKKYKAALSLMDEYSPSLSEHPDFYALKASIDEISSNYSEAVELYTQLVENFSDNASWWVGLGIAYQSMGKMSEAKNAYGKALALGGLDPAVQAYIHQQMRSN